MSDETPMPETLETIAASIRDLRTAMDSRFASMDSRFASMDSRFDELKAQLRTEIESVRGDVRLVAEAFGAQTTRLERHERTDKTFKKRLDGHDTRLLALERKSLP
jgi:hypothetical protein